MHSFQFEKVISLRMDMIPKIQMLPRKKLVGLHLTTGMAANQTAELWKTFMPRRKEILHPANNFLISMDVFDPHASFENFNANTIFEKWAVVEVVNFDDVPANMTRFELPPGLYAVFNYKGSSSAGQEVFNYIFREWLPASGYKLDQRPHLAIMGEKYRNNDWDSEEDLCIPVTKI